MTSHDALMKKFDDLEVDRKALLAVCKMLQDTGPESV